MDLKFITTDNSGIYIVNGTLAYNNNENITILITGNDQPGKALKCSEFTSFLRGQSYLTGGIKYVDTIDIPQEGASISNVNLYYRNPSKINSDVPFINITEDAGEEIIFWINSEGDIEVRGQDDGKDIKVCDSWGARELNYFGDKINSLYDKYIDLENPEDEIYNQISSRYSENYYTKNYIKTYDLLSVGDYTNQINIKQYIYKSELPGISGKLDVSVFYSYPKNLSSQDLETVVYTVSFTAFSYSSEGILNNPVKIFGDENIQVEYIDGILSVYPKTTKVTECIINNCILSYGKL